MGLSNEIELFDFHNEDIRVVMIEGEPWFVAADVCRVLGISDIRQAVERLDDGDVCLAPTPTNGGTQPMRVVNEPGLYELIIRSDKPAARPFRRWITTEVIPMIRKTGSYAMPVDELELAERYVEIIKEKRKVQAALEIAAPKAEVRDKYLGANQGDYIAAIGRMLGFEYAGDFWFALEELGAIYRKGPRSRPVATDKWLELGYMEMRGRTPVITDEGLKHLKTIEWEDDDE